MTALPDVSSHAMARARWRPGEVAFWILALACAFLFPSRYLIMTDIVRLALFALSLDLILGYAGIVSLGHAAFFGVGAYCAGLLASSPNLWSRCSWPGSSPRRSAFSPASW